MYTGIHACRCAFIKGDIIMATKMKERSIDVTGLSIKEIMNIDLDTFNRLGQKDLRAITSRLVSAGNKRIRRLEERGINSPAYMGLGSDARLSIDFGKGIKGSQLTSKLRQEFSRARSFLSASTSTIKGYQQYQTKLRETFEEKTGRTLSSGELSNAISILHKLQESGKIAGRGTKGSDFALQQIFEVMESNKDFSELAITQRTLKEYRTEYEKEPQKQFEIIGVKQR